MNEGLVDLGPISLQDAKAMRVALAYIIESGGAWDAEQYAAIVSVKAMLNVRIAFAEQAVR